MIFKCTYFLLRWVVNKLEPSEIFFGIIYTADMIVKRAYRLAPSLDFYTSKIDIDIFG